MLFSALNMGGARPVARAALVAALVATILGLAACSSDDAEPVPAYPEQMLWTNAKGKTQPNTVISSEPGPQHCEWQNVTFLSLGPNPSQGGKQYLRDPAGTIRAEYLATSYAANVELPSDARDTGFRREGSALWVTADAAYIVTPNGTERWPQTVGHGVYCA